jgi:hypothetical protein
MPIVEPRIVAGQKRKSHSSVRWNDFFAFANRLLPQGSGTLRARGN